MIATIVSIIALLLIVVQGRLAWQEGLFRAVARFLFVTIAVLVALRFWHPYTGWLVESLDMPFEQLALAGFWTLFAVVFVPLNALLGSINNDFVPEYPSGMDRVGGMICGALTAWLLCAAVVLSAMPLLPKYAASYDPAHLLLPLDRLPLALYAGLEGRVTGLPEGDAGRTVLPKIGSEPGEPLKVSW